MKNLQPRLESLNIGLIDEYVTASCKGDLEPFEQLLNRIETDLQRYRECCTHQ